MNALYFVIGFVVCFLTISCTVGIAYSAAVMLGRGLGMIEGVQIAVKVFFRSRATSMSKINRIKKSIDLLLGNKEFLERMSREKILRDLLSIVDEK